jgi:hypothetical protein
MIACYWTSRRLAIDISEWANREGIMTPMPWAQSFCHQYIYFLFYVGGAAVIVGILLGIALAAAAVIIAIRKPPVVSASTAVTEDIANPTPVIDSIRAFIQAIAAAPTWLALFGGGLLLLWLAGFTTPDICKPVPPAAAAAARPAH